MGVGGKIWHLPGYLGKNIAKKKAKLSERKRVSANSTSSPEIYSQVLGMLPQRHSPRSGTLALLEEVLI